MATDLDAVRTSVGSLQHTVGSAQTDTAKTNKSISSVQRENTQLREKLDAVEKKVTSLDKSAKDESMKIARLESQISFRWVQEIDRQELNGMGNGLNLTIHKKDQTPDAIYLHGLQQILADVPGFRRIFTDGSKSEDGRVGAAAVMDGRVFTRRLANGSSVYSA
nr:hypothetical protein BaRGS_026205 [Batillaria attramentaria]